jgi:hypothetical protein
MKWLVALLSAVAWIAPVRAQVTVYEHGYMFNSGDLNENHFIVLDSTTNPPRGWYYGTSDEFDAAREGYLPGFFVQRMRDLVVIDDRISFTLERPRVFFTAPVPLRYRTIEEMPVGTLGIWAVRLPEGTARYEGSVTPGLITLRLERGERVFRRTSP